MENKTAEEIADNIIDNLLCFGMSLPDRIPNRKLIVTALNVYASLQCAEMKTENERLKAELLQRDTTWLPAKDAELELQQKRIEKLEEALSYTIERLRDDFDAPPDNYLNKILCSKESKTPPHDTINKP